MGRRAVRPPFTCRAPPPPPPPRPVTTPATWRTPNRCVVLPPFATSAFPPLPSPPPASSTARTPPGKAVSCLRPGVDFQSPASKLFGVGACNISAVLVRCQEGRKLCLFVLPNALCGFVLIYCPTGLYYTKQQKPCKWKPTVKEEEKELCSRARFGLPERPVLTCKKNECASRTTPHHLCHSCRTAPCLRAAASSFSLGDFARECTSLFQLQKLVTCSSGDHAGM